MTPPPRQEPRLSVLIGCWNNAATLARAIESILSQTFGDFELIVVDDGSEDGTAELVRSFDDPRLDYFPRRHEGISPSLNAGIERARGDYVAIQDADDYSFPERLERQAALLDSSPGVAVVGARMREETEDGEELAERTSFAPGDVTGKLMRFNPIPNSIAMFRRDVVLGLGGFRQRFLYAMDYDLWLRVADHHRVMTIDEPLGVRVMSTRNVAATKEREQTREAIAIRLETMRRRRTPAGATGLFLPLLSYLTPTGLKRGRRRRLGQAP